MLTTAKKFILNSLRVILNRCKLAIGNNHFVMQVLLLKSTANNRASHLEEKHQTPIQVLNKALINMNESSMTNRY